MISNLEARSRAGRADLGSRRVDGGIADNQRYRSGVGSAS